MIRVLIISYFSKFSAFDTSETARVPNMENDSDDSKKSIVFRVGMPHILKANVTSVMRKRCKKVSCAILRPPSITLRHVTSRHVTNLATETALFLAERSVTKQVHLQINPTWSPASDRQVFHLRRYLNGKLDIQRRTKSFIDNPRACIEMDTMVQSHTVCS